MSRVTRGLWILIASAVLAPAAPALACEIEDYSYQEKAGSLYISGATTCPSGRLSLRLYDGATDEFLASDFTYVRGYTFQTYIDSRVPRRLKLKYVIEPR